MVTYRDKIIAHYYKWQTSETKKCLRLISLSFLLPTNIEITTVVAVQ